jgi:hypothetical protein
MELKHLIMILVFLLLMGTVNAAYVDDISQSSLKDIKYFDNDTVVGLDGFNFTIPKGFGLIENESVDDVDGNYTDSARFFANESGDIIMIETTSIVRHDLILSDYTPCDVDMSKTTIDGHEGIRWRMDNATYFIYFDDDYLISVGATDSDFFEDII